MYYYINMKIAIQKLNIPPKNFLKQCGYLEIQNPHKNNEISYARSLDPGRFYPRFHAYPETAGKNFSLNLHLDMKKPSYEGSAAHGGEYGGAAVENESARIKSISEKFLPEKFSGSLGFRQKKSWWQRLFS